MNRLNELKEVLPLLWNSYQHMYDTREHNLQNNINFFLVISTFLPLFCIGLYSTTRFENPIILSPVIIHFYSIIILLRSFSIKSSPVYWFEFNTLLNRLEDESLIPKFVAEIKALEGVTYTNMIVRGNIIKKVTSLIIISLIIIINAIICIIFYLNYVVFIILSVLIILIYYLTKDFLNINVKYKYEEECIAYSKKINEWLK